MLKRWCDALDMTCYLWHFVGPLLSFPIINAQIKVEEMSVSQDSSPAMGQACATQCITKVHYVTVNRLFKFHTIGFFS